MSKSIRFVKYDVPRMMDQSTFLYWLHHSFCACAPVCALSCHLRLCLLAQTAHSYFEAWGQGTITYILQV